MLSKSPASDNLSLWFLIFSQKLWINSPRSNFAGTDFARVGKSYNYLADISVNLTLHRPLVSTFSTYLTANIFPMRKPLLFPMRIGESIPLVDLSAFDI